MKKLLWIFLPAIIVTFTLFVCSCSGKESKTEKIAEDTIAKNTMQGIWIDEFEGDCVFRAKGDSIYYTDSLSEPVRFHILSDTLFLESSHPSALHILKLSEHVLRIVNNEGEEMSLTKTDDKSYLSFFENTTMQKSHINQNQLIKRDSVILSDDHRYHAYVQVNPTRYKVLRQSINEDGVIVDHAYYDNIIHIALYDGARAIISRDYRKKDFSKIVPSEYIEQAILSDIIIDRATSEGVNFIAVISTPDTYTSYHVNIHVNAEGIVSITL